MQKRNEYPEEWGCLDENQKDTIKKWYEKEQKKQKNDHIIVFCVFALVFAVYSYFLLFSNPNQQFGFRYVTNSHGEKTSLFGSILCYLFVFWIQGTVVFSVAFLFMEVCYIILWYIKGHSEKIRFDSSYPLGGITSPFIAVIAYLIIFIIYIFGIAKLPI